MRAALVMSWLLWCTVANAAAMPAAPTTEQQADAAFERKEWAAAATAYDAVIRAGTQQARPYLRLGIARQQLKQYDAATTAYEKALALGTPGATVANYNLACLYATTNRDKAFHHLAAAWRGGAAQATSDRDPDLAPLRSDARWAALKETIDRETRPCRYDIVYRQFDFWLGSWDVMASGTRAGTSTIEAAAEGCLLVENWTDANGRGGKSLNFFHPRERRWRQTWVGADGEVVEFHGDVVDGEMRFSASGTDKNKKAWQRRLTFTPKDEGGVHRVRQFAERSDDGGRTFKVEYDLLYVPRAK